jgi:phosphate starvation-inducible membrane PsiE
MKAWEKGALVGGLVGVTGTFVTYLTGDISFISLPVVLLFSLFGAGLLFLFLYFELFTLVVVYGLIGAIIGYLIGGKK